MSNSVVQTMTIYDDRFVKYHSDFYEKRVVHQPFLSNYLEAVISQYDDDTTIHVVLYDSKTKDGTSYISEAKDIINRSNVVVHIIAPCSYYTLPECPMIYYYIEINKDTEKRTQKLKELISQDSKEERIMLVVCEDYRAITLNYAREEQPMPTGR